MDPIDAREAEMGALVAFLENFANDFQPFLPWLSQYDMLDEDEFMLALAVVGTQVWRQVYTVTGQAPDRLDLATVKQVARARPYLIVPPDGIPAPAPQSAWRDLTLDGEDYTAAVTLMARKLAATLGVSHLKEG